MYIDRDFKPDLLPALPIKVLKGPRQVGKTTLLQSLKGYEVVYLDDAATRRFASEEPRLFLDQLPSKVILDEAALSPELFPELKRRIDEARRKGSYEVDYWITSSNQTLLQKEVQESLAGRASFFDLNTLSIHELGHRYKLANTLFNGGWPELYVNESLSSIRYLNDLLSTFVEKDIISAAGIEKRAALVQTLRLVAGRIGQLFNASEIASHVGVESTTVKSWLSILELNGLIREIRPFHTNRNKRLVKTPKWYFEDTGLATRLQGWTELQPLLVSPAIGHLIENIALSEILRFFGNRGERAEIYFLRSKEKVEIDFLLSLPNERWVAIEVKSNPQEFTVEQQRLIDSLELNIVEQWIVTPANQTRGLRSKIVPFIKLWEELARLV